MYTPFLSFKREGVKFVNLVSLCVYGHKVCVENCVNFEILCFRLDFKESVI